MTTRREVLAGAATSMIAVSGCATQEGLEGHETTCSGDCDLVEEFTVNEDCSGFSSCEGSMSVVFHESFTGTVAVKLYSDLEHGDLEDAVEKDVTDKTIVRFELDADIDDVEYIINAEEEHD